MPGIAGREGAVVAALPEAADQAFDDPVGAVAQGDAHAFRKVRDLRRATFVTKPNSIRRVALTLPVRWPGLEGHVDAPDYAFPDGISNLVGVLGVIDEMVGDLDRIMRYPALGFQVACPIPAQVMDAWERLVARGFDRHLVNPPR